MNEPSRTPLHRFMERRGARFVDFCGYELPMQFVGKGFIHEHTHCREKAALFDVSHMGQFKVRGDQDETSPVFPVNPWSLMPGQGKYTQLLRPDGGTIDDLIVANDGGFLFIVFNASRKSVAVKTLLERAPHAEVEAVENALFALQGPSAEAVLAEVFPDAAGLDFMDAGWMMYDGHHCRVSRSGYTGEDGFEVSAPAECVEDLCERLARHPDFGVAGLGARDSLRLEAGLCLYGNELDEETTPVEAALAWSIPKSRRRAGMFVGSEKVCEQISNGPSRKLVGLEVIGKTPIRAGTALHRCGDVVGKIASGLYSPTRGIPIATAYVAAEHAASGTGLETEVRGKRVECSIVKPPFVEQNYKR